MKMRGADGGQLFWDDFEKRVIDCITEEHNLLKRAREDADFWETKYRNQKEVFLTATDMFQLSFCESCKDFFLYDENDQSHFTCECGNKFCGQELSPEEGEWCKPVPCDGCKRNFQHCCLGFCNECDKSYCNTCVPNNDELELEIAKEDGTGSGMFLEFCSIACREKTRIEGRKCP